MKLRTLDLFSGIGGFTLGLERTGGFKTVAFCEVSKPCRHLLAHHWPEAPCHDDVRTLTADRLLADGIEVDAICAGFPCQDLSFAGRGAGLGGDRSGLFLHIVRLAREIAGRTGRLPLMVLENVSALLVRGFGTVAGELAALGYDLWWDCIPASAVGAPHRRDRVWIVAYPGGEQHQGYGHALRRAVAAGLSGDLADASRVQPGRAEQWSERERAGEGGEPLPMADTKVVAFRPRLLTHGATGRRRGRPGDRGCSNREWLSEPDVGRVAHGVPARVDRLHGLGNAVVPQIPELIGRAIIAAGLAA